MSTQTGKFTRALSLSGTTAAIKMLSDTVNIPYAGTKYVEGTNTSTGGNKLNDSAANFLSTGTKPLDVKVGDTVWNYTDGTCAYVTNVDSATALSLSENIFTATAKEYRLFRSSDMWYGSTPNCYLYIGTGGGGKVTTAGGDDITFAGVPSGTILPIQVSRVWSSGSPTWSNIVALW
jgi:hypothetical protein